MPTPSCERIIGQLLTICSSLQIVNESLAITYASKAITFPYLPVVLGEGENIDVLRSPVDTYSVQGELEARQRVNAFAIDEASFAQSLPVTPNDRRIIAPIGFARIDRVFRIWHFYQFGEASKLEASRYVEALRKRLNQLPKLNFTDEYANFVEGHERLQMPFIDTAPFDGVYAHVYGGQLTVRLLEPQQ